MRAAVMTKPFTIEFREVAQPVPKPHEVLVRVQAAGICGSDVHFYDGSNPYANYPQIFGHELAGVVEGVGDDAPSSLAGKRVVVEPAVPCGRCYACSINRPNACANIDMIGSVRAGGFADYVTVPAHHVHVMPDDMRFEVGAVCEPFSIGAQAIRRSGIKGGETVAILGMGPIGLTILSQLKRTFDVTVFAIDVVPERLQLALDFGADAVIDARNMDVVAHILSKTNGEGANIVLEAAGVPNTIEQTIHLVSAAGRIVIVGLTGQDVKFPGQLLTKKDIEIYGTRHSVGLFPAVMQFLHEHPDVADKFISQRMNFTELESALKLAKRCPAQVTKIILFYS
ncbi:putative zinc-type alcohol dehydrogenase-like protein YjmD [Alicyclobacillus acidoterrestris]|nr:putative zinc-type alcohol dehydrogenase-like protein YjmD [Alicyclobacillus acidoterrestris]